VGLHGVLIPAHDFDYWLEEGPAAKLVESLSESTTGPVAPVPVVKSAAPIRPKRGPKPKTVDRYGKADRCLYPQIGLLVADGLTLTAATQKLADQGKVAGTGTATSCARRLARRHSKDQKLAPTRSY
jgi:hypothetical protein